MKNGRLDMAQLLADYGVEFRESSNGWLQLHCPLCYRGDGKMGLGWSGTVFNCFRCGRLRLMDVLPPLLRLTPPKTIEVLVKYRKRVIPRSNMDHTSSAVLGGVLGVKMPSGTGKLTAPHLKYLKSRGFDPETARTWGLLGTGAVGPLPWRIVAPIVQDGKAVCWQARAISPDARERYKTCPDAEAVIQAKDCLYGIDQARERSTVVVTEGITKVWRLGPGAVATFGATVTERQAELLWMGWKAIFILFDRDEAGNAGAAKLAGTLAPLGMKVVIIQLPNELRDAADMTQEDADQLMGNLQ